MRHEGDVPNNTFVGVVASIWISRAKSAVMIRRFHDPKNLGIVNVDMIC